MAETKATMVEELPTTLYLSDFGLYFTNWPKHWVLANHGAGCKFWNNSVGFIFGSRSTTEGTFQIEISEDLEEDYFSTFEVVKREVWSNKKKVDVSLATVDGKVKVDFLNLNRKHEKWVLENLGFLPPIEESEIKEVSFPKFPIFAPQKRQEIHVLLGFGVLSEETNYQISFRNATSRLGVSCNLREGVTGKVKTSLGESTKRITEGDVITLEAEDETIIWKLMMEKEKFLITETEKGKTQTLFEVPISKDYDFSFYAMEY
ncbi:MAG: hypothetical protein AAGA43_13695 [Bacteroidota bacterium]